MGHRNKAVAALVALAATATLAACGSSSENENETVSASFQALADVPAADKGVAGQATLERVDGATTVEVSFTGLEPKTAYVAHLHSGSCGETDPGGPHFKFDPNGSEEPPNEIHLEFESGADGSAKAQASSDREVPVGEAGSVVLHEAGEEHGSGHDHTTAATAGDSPALLVHDEGHAEHGGEGHEAPERSAPAKVACAELEGNSAKAVAAGPTIVIRDGEPLGGVQKLEYDAGDQVAFTVKSDVADEVHVHGYDLSEDVPAGGEVSFDFAAAIEGIFEIELEGRKEQIAELLVNP